MKHGTQYAYRQGCRCNVCKPAQRERERLKWQKRKARLGIADKPRKLHTGDVNGPSEPSRTKASPESLAAAEERSARRAARRRAVLERMGN